MVDLAKLTQAERNNYFRRALGLTDRFEKPRKLPTYGIDPVPLGGFGGLRIGLRPIGEKGARRRMTHRIYIHCSCGKVMSAGRIVQHLNSKGHDV